MSKNLEYKYSIEELANILRKSYDQSSSKVLSIHLFGIKYGFIIKKSNFTAKDIILQAGLYYSYITELNKGINLSKFVELKKEL